MTDFSGFWQGPCAECCGIPCSSLTASTIFLTLSGMTICTPCIPSFGDGNFYTFSGIINGTYTLTGSPGSWTLTVTGVLTALQYSDGHCTDLLGTFTGDLVIFSDCGTVAGGKGFKIIADFGAAPFGPAEMFEADFIIADRPIPNLFDSSHCGTDFFATGGTVSVTE